jgi:beta-N-acetylhexosaminidase
MSLGPVMLDLAGCALGAAERERLCHPLAGGVILFEHNYESPEQLESLVREIHGLRRPQLLVAVDQEGGRIQRFRHGFTQLPAPRRLGQLYDENRKRAKRLAQTCGWLMASELRAVGVDLSFAPVVDLDRGVSGVIGDRAFHADPEAVADIAHSYITGMAEAGMAATAKHFPGHGSVVPDSHLTLPVDPREYTDIQEQDMLAFERLIHYGVPAIMAAHVAYPRVDSQPAGFSRVWIQDVLRERLRFQGAVFSDDLTMGAARGAGGALERASAALGAGCDMVLVCQDVDGADQILQGLTLSDDPASHIRLMRMHGRHSITRATLADDERYQQAQHMVTGLA